MNLVKRVSLLGGDPYSLPESSENIYFRENKVEPRKSFVFIFNIIRRKIFLYN